MNQSSLSDKRNRLLLAAAPRQGSGDAGFVIQSRVPSYKFASEAGQGWPRCQRLSDNHRANLMGDVVNLRPRERRRNGSKPSKKRGQPPGHGRTKGIERNTVTHDKAQLASTTPGSKRETGNEIASHQALDLYRVQDQRQP